MNDNKRLKRKVRNSYIASTASMALVLFLLGSVGYLLSAAMQATDALRGSIAVTVELRNGLDEGCREAIGERLAAHELVSSVTYATREEKLADEDFRRMFGSEYEELLEENPLRDSYELTLTAGSADKEAAEAFVAEISAVDGVERVSLPLELAERLHATVGKIRLVLLLFGGALLAVSLVLLSNTIRLAIYSKRYQINTMKLVGATKWFIMKPFLATGVSQGVLAGVAAAVLFLGAVYGLQEAVPELTTLAELRRIAAIAGIMVAAGVVASTLFTAAALNRFINMKSNKIYLY